jgi:hypothetical protein
MGAVGVLDGEVVQPELLLYLAKKLLRGLVEADPDELAGELKDLADVLEIDIPHPFSVARIGDAVDDLSIPRGFHG